jgi:ribosomal protein S6 kinase alpha-5
MDFTDYQLGDGSHSVVRRCVHGVTDTEYAVKIISKEHYNNHEVKMLKLAQGHPNIVRLHEVLEDDVSIEQL